MGRHLTVAAAVLLTALASACSSDPPAADLASPGRSLTHQELEVATDVARDEADRQRATITSATVTVRRAQVRQPNTGHECTSPRLLRIRLVGRFPRVVASGPPGGGEVRGLLLIADPASHVVCLVGAQVENVEPRPHAIPLTLDWSVPVCVKRSAPFTYGCS